MLYWTETSYWRWQPFDPWRTALIETSKPKIQAGCTHLNESIDMKRKNRLVILNNHPLLRGFLVDIERLSLYNNPFSINSYLSSKESSRRSRVSTQTDQSCKLLYNHCNSGMRNGRQYLMDNMIPRQCIPINADVRTFDWRVGFHLLVDCSNWPQRKRNWRVDYLTWLWWILHGSWPLKIHTEELGLSCRIDL